MQDHILSETISVPAKSLFGDQAKGNLTYNDINGRPLSLPTLVFPFRRALYFMSYYAYKSTVNSRTPHVCADLSRPTEEEWEAIKSTVITDSTCGDELAFITDSIEGVNSDVRSN